MRTDAYAALTMCASKFAQGQAWNHCSHHGAQFSAENALNFLHYIKIGTESPYIQEGFIYAPAAD